MFYEFEKNTRDKEWSMSEMHSHSHYELYILLQGTRNIFLENNIFRAQAFTVVLIPPFVMHKTEGDKFSRININFSSDYFSKTETEVFSKNLSKKFIVVPPHERERLQKILSQLETPSAENTKESAVFTRCLTYELFYFLCECDKNGHYQTVLTPSVKYPSTLIKFLDYVNRNIESDLSLKSAAEKFYVSEGYLSKVFKKYMNVPASTYILNLRLTKAKQYLTDTKKSVEEISQLCGFSSANYFGLIFKKTVGLSPRNYRKYQNEKRY